MKRTFCWSTSISFAIAIAVVVLLSPQPLSAQSVNCSGVAAWATGVSYTPGVLATYSGSEYKCVQANTSQTGWEPPNVPALWSLVGACSSGGGGSTPTPTPTATPTPTSSGGCTPTAITPYIEVGSGSWQQTASVSAASGSSVTFGPQPTSGGSWSWSGPNGYSSTSRQITVTITSTSTYTATYTNASGCKSTQSFTVTVAGGGATPTPTAVSGCSPSISPYMEVNGGSWQAITSVSVSTGTPVNFGPQPATGGSWSWSGPGGFTSTTRQITIAIPSSSTYTVTYTNASGCVSTQAFTVTTTGGAPASPPNGTLGQKPYMGWSSWSQEALTTQGGFAWLTESQVKTQSDNLRSKLQGYSYNRLNIDSGWAGGFDAYGRYIPNDSTFPDGMASTISYIHNNGQLAGIYATAGLSTSVYNANTPILGTPYTVQQIVVEPLTNGNGWSGASYMIDFTKPGAQQYINSIVNMYASWGVDFIKLDGMTPGSNMNGQNNSAEAQAWWNAIQSSGRQIWLELSWALDHDYVGYWQYYSNGRRIENDVECYCSTVTDWNAVSLRFSDLVTWETNSGPGLGWNDLDSIDVGVGSMDGLSNDERQSAITLWAIGNAELFVGDDLTKLDSYGLQLLTNSEVIAVDQSGHPGQQITGGNSQVWASNNGDGTYYVALFNLSGSTATNTVSWSSLGFSGSADVQDLWAQSDLGSYSGSFSASLSTHASRLLKVTPSSRPASGPVTSGDIYLIVNKSTGSVLDDPGSSYSNGTLLDEWQSNGGANQEWIATSVGPYWTFTNRASGKLLDNPGSSTAINTQLDQWQSKAGYNQQWTLTAVGDGSYKIVNRYSGLVMDVQGGNATNGTEIIQYSDNGGTNQHWTFQQVN